MTTRDNVAGWLFKFVRLGWGEMTDVSVVWVNSLALKCARKAAARYWYCWCALSQISLCIGASAECPRLTASWPRGAALSLQPRCSERSAYAWSEHIRRYDCLADNTRIFV
jgi:hypothetical protein